MTAPTGHPRESDLRWTASPMWLAMMDAAVACGVEDRMDAARITDAKVWAKVGDPNWPSADKAVRDRFQLLWTANVQARCGIDPLSNPGNATGVASHLSTATPRVVEVAAGLSDNEVEAIRVRYLAGETISGLAECFEVSRDRVAALLTSLGIARRPKWYARKREAEAAAARICALFDAGVPTATIATQVGRTVHHTTAVLRSHGRSRHGANQWTGKRQVAA